MKKNKRFEDDKKLIALDKEYSELRQASHKSGTFIDVEPYQRGWRRYFVPRDDIKNRMDIKEIRQALDLINSVDYSHRKDFKEKDWKTKKWLTKEKKLKYINDAKYQALSEKLRSFFVLREWYEESKYFKTKTFISAYVFKNDYWFVHKIEPRIIRQHWIPDAEVESRLGELRRKFESEFLWPKVTRARSKSVGYSNYDMLREERRKERLLEEFQMDGQDDILWGDLTDISE